MLHNTHMNVGFLGKNIEITVFGHYLAKADETLLNYTARLIQVTLWALCVIIPLVQIYYHGISNALEKALDAGKPFSVVTNYRGNKSKKFSTAGKKLKPV